MRTTTSRAIGCRLPSGSLTPCKGYWQLLNTRAIKQRKTESGWMRHLSVVNCFDMPDAANVFVGIHEHVKSPIS